MPAEWALSIVVPIFNRKGGIRNCSCYRAMKFFNHVIKVVERVIEKKLHNIVAVSEMQVRFMPMNGTIDAMFILRRLQKEHHVIIGKCFTCILWA